jgi:hypothetical protein
LLGFGTALRASICAFVKKNAFYIGASAQVADAITLVDVEYSGLIGYDFCR